MQKVVEKLDLKFLELYAKKKSPLEFAIFKIDKKKKDKKNMLENADFKMRK